MAVRSRLPWPWRLVAITVLLAIVGGMWWWGFDFGQFFGGINRKEVLAKLVTLEADNTKLKTEAAQLRSRTTQLESDLAITTGAQSTLSKQALELMAENTQLKEELSFLQKLFADSNKQPGLSIAKLNVEREREDVWHYSALVVRAEFEGGLSLTASLQHGDGGTRTTLTLPDDQPESAPALKLKFKYYQRLEGTIRVPEGAQLRSVTARAFEAGQASARASRTLAIP